MIARASTARGFVELARYLERDKHDPERSRAAHFWSAHCFGARAARVAADLMEITARQNARVERPAYHVIISFGSRERPTSEQTEEVARRVLDALDLRAHQAMLIAHADRPHPHVHLVANRVHPVTLKGARTSFDFARIERAIRVAEHDMGLDQVPGHHAPTPDGVYAQRSRSRPVGARRVELRGMARARELGELAPESFLTRARRETRDGFANARTWESLERYLSARGYHLQARDAGLAITDGTHGAAVSAVSPMASIHKLEIRFGRRFGDHRREFREFAAVRQDFGASGNASEHSGKNDLPRRG